MNQEILYKAIQEENWTLILNILYKHRDEINNDFMLKAAAQIFESEFFSKVKSYSTDRQDIIDNLYMIHEGHFYKLGPSSHIILISEIVRRKNEVSELAYNYSKIYPDDPICKSIIERFELKCSKEVNHSQIDTIHISERKIVDDEDFRICLFKSIQEKEFFLALKQIFDSYQIYPNVAASCLLDWNNLCAKLSQDEKDYFFKCIIDFVVFDQAQDYLPIHFFELDSPFHDLEKQKEKDGLKDSIFAKAGIKIHRIRKKNITVGQEEFIIAIRDILKQ